MVLLTLFLTTMDMNAQEVSLERLQNQLGFELSETNKVFYEATGLVKCASYEYNEKQRHEGKLSSNEVFERVMNRAVAKEKQDIANGRAATTYTIPVVIHIYHKGEAIGTGTNLSVAAIESQITVLNQDFRKMAGTPGHNTNAVGADTEIQFCLAKKDSNGAVTTGITRQQGIAGAYTTATFDAVKPNTQWDPTKYLNIWVADLGAQLLGYAQFPHANNVITGMAGGYAGSNANTDGVVMGPNFFGSSDITTVNGQAPYDKGRTTTHEVGHWLGLKHITGDSACGDDNCADTPTQQAQSNQQTACNPTTTCSSQDMIQNYMDYSNDTCMNIFTVDQTTRMRAILNPANNIVNRGTLVQAGTTHTLCSSNPDYTITATNSPVTVCKPNNAVFNLTFVTLNGYNSNTVFSVSAGLPTNATATFNPTSLSANGNIALTIGNITNVAAGNYILTVKGDGTIDKTINVVLNVESGIPTVPVLTAPTNGATNQLTAVNLTWNAITGATSYIVQRATNAAFSTNLVTNTVTTNSYNATGLLATTKYYWRVKAKNGCGESANSSAFNFTTATNTCNTTVNNNVVNIPNATTNGTEAAPGISTIAINNNVTINDINVTVDIAYSYVADLRLVLESPDGTKIDLVKNLTDANNGPGSKDNFTDTIFDDAATTSITAATAENAPFTGTYKPQNPLSIFNGKSSQGNWKLSVYDNWTAGTGTIKSWKIEICGSNVLGIDDSNFYNYELENSFKLWPNPSNGNVTVTFKSSSNNKKITLSLFDLRGRLITEKKINQSDSFFKQELGFNNIQSAVYILKIQTGTSKLIKRLVIE